jgi:glycosyltransferase involved in cell wall biosynthesis
MPKPPAPPQSAGLAVADDAAAPLVSIVTPFGNHAQSLGDCIESVLRQRHENFELVLIDNHGADGAAEVARRYAERDPRLRVIRAPQRLPRIESYNFALEQVSPDSEYVRIVAPTERLTANGISEMVELAVAHPSVAIVSSYSLRGAHVEGSGLEPERKVISGREACRLHLLHGVFLFGAPTTQMYRADLLEERRPFFASGRVHPDTEAVFEILANADFGFVHQVLSFSRPHAEAEVEQRAPLEFKPDALDRFIIVSQYGPVYLDQHEFREVLAGATRWYYSVLARAWLKDRVGRAPEGFWEYHRSGLESIAEEVQPELLMLALGRLLTRGVLSPLEAVRGTTRSLLKRR